MTRVYAPLGATLREVPWCVAGDLCALTRLGVATTGDTLCTADDPVGLDGWELPEALLPVAVTAADRTAQDAMARGLARLAATETTLRVERNEDTHQIVLWCTGEAHADVVLARLRASGANVEVTDVAVPERETVAGPATGLGRHVKQSGGHGQFAVCRIEIEPLPRGSGVEFVDRIVGGAIPRAYIPGVEKGVRAQLDAGVTPGRPGGRRAGHPASTARRTASTPPTRRSRPRGRSRSREAVAAAGTVVMERLYEVEVAVDDGQLGVVLGDLVRPSRPRRRHRAGRAGVHPRARRGPRAGAPALRRGPARPDLGDGVLHPALQPLRTGRGIAPRAFRTSVRLTTLPAHRSRGSPR